MSTQPSLFDGARPARVRYPDVAGAKASGTSAEAAAAATVHAATWRRAVRACLAQHGPLTADECAARLGVSVLTIRPRVSELRARSAIVDTGVRRRNVSGKRAVVWALA